MVDERWLRDFRERMEQFDGDHDGDGIGVSIKVRIQSGCFHREHSPHAYREIDDYLQRHPPKKNEFAIEEHESGPEVLAYILLMAGVANLTAAIINVVTAILKARSDGIQKGDHPREPLHVIIRLIAETDYREKEVLKVEYDKSVNKSVLENSLNQALLEVTAELAKKPKKSAKQKKGKKK